MLEAWYPQIRMTHIGCVTLSGSLFFARGALRAAGSAFANHRVLRFGSYAIDTMLLAAAIVLTTIVHQYPFVNGWLTVKLVLLILYVGLGTLALKRGRTPRIRLIAFAAALFTFVCMIGVAIAHAPAGWLTLIR